LKALPSIAIDNFLIGFLINLRAALNLFSFLALLAFSLSLSLSLAGTAATDRPPFSQRASKSLRFRKDALFARRQNVNTLFSAPRSLNESLCLFIAPLSLIALH